MPLERKLPLLMTAVLLVMVAAGILVVDHESRRANEVVSTRRLQDVSTKIAGLIASSRPVLATRLRTALADTAVQRVLLAEKPTAADSAKISAFLARLALPSDSGLVSEIWTPAGSVVATSGDESAYGDRPSLPPQAAAVDSLSIGPFFASAGRVYYWSAMPITMGKRVIGTIAQRRRLNYQPRTERDIVGLSGQDSRILFRNTEGGFWTTLGGRQVPAPTDVKVVRSMQTFSHPDVSPNGRVVISQTPVEGTPWVVALELPESKLGAPSRDLLTRFALFSVLLLVSGALAVWIISRRITSPLARMTAAAEAMARGDYSHRVDETGDDEIAKLGASFNHMATKVQAANDNLTSAADTAAKARQIAEDANAAKANFLAAMSHELRTPLNAIAGYVDLLEMGLRGPLTSEQQTDLSRIRRSQQYLLGLIEQVLVFTQLDAKQVAINLQDVSLDELMHDAETMIAPQISARGISYSYRPAHPGLIVRADPEKTQQIVLNLLTNGVKYTDPGGKVTASAEMRNGSALLRVHDTGAGIPDRMLTHIFEPFVQLDRRLNQPRDGVGLGLTISRDLARAMGGDLLVESAVGSGSTFTLVLPRKDDSASS
jgi:signal transduction histidine kinase